MLCGQKRWTVVHRPVESLWTKRPRKAPRSRLVDGRAAGAGVVGVVCRFGAGLLGSRLLLGPISASITASAALCSALAAASAAAASAARSASSSRGQLLLGRKLLALGRDGELQLDDDVR